MTFKDPELAQAEAKKSWQNRDLPNWRSQVDVLLKGKQIIVNGWREWNSIYVAAKRKWVRALCIKISDSQFAVSAARRYGRKIRFIQAGNVYFARDDELVAFSKAAKRAGVSLDCQMISCSPRGKVFRIVLQRTKSVAVLGKPSLRIRTRD